MKKTEIYKRLYKDYSKKYLNKIYLIKPLLRKEIYKYQKNHNTVIAETKKLLIIGARLEP